MSTTTTTTRWYAARLRPGAVRRDRTDTRLTVVERDLRLAGFDFYLPTEVRDIVHHRTKKIVQKSFPLIPGYVFLPDVTDFWSLSKCKTIAGVIGVEGRPLAMPDTEMAMIRKAESACFAALAEHRRARAVARTRTTRRDLTHRYLPSAAITVTTGFLSENVGRVVDVTGRGTVKVVLDRLANLGVIELPVDEIQLVA